MLKVFYCKHHKFWYLKKLHFFGPEMWAGTFQVFLAQFFRNYMKHFVVTPFILFTGKQIYVTGICFAHLDELTSWIKTDRSVQKSVTSLWNVKVNQTKFMSVQTFVL